MKTSFFSFIIFIVASLFSSSAAAQNDDQASFEAYLKTIYTAFETGGYDVLKQYYTVNSTEIGPDGKLVVGWAVMEANWLEMEKMLDGKPKFTYHLTSWRLIRPDVAIVTWDSEDEFQMQGQKITGKNTASAVLRKEKGQWLIEHDQLTPKVEFQMPGN